MPDYPRKSFGRGKRLLALASAALISVVAGCGTSSDQASDAGTTAPTTSLAPTTTAAPNVYAKAGANALVDATRDVPYRLYVPNSDESSMMVIDPATNQVVDKIAVGRNPQHVVPSWDLKTLYVTNDLSNSLTPIDPKTSKRAGPDIPVDDPYNMYFTPDGQY